MFYIMYHIGGRYMELDIKEFVGLPFSKQDHKCCLRWCHNNHVAPFPSRGRMAKEYFQCRAYLMKLPTQTIKNICIMLHDGEKPCSIYDMEELSKRYVRSSQEQSEKEKLANLTDKKEYDMTAALASFLDVYDNHGSIKG